MSFRLPNFSFWEEIKQNLVACGIWSYAKDGVKVVPIFYPNFKLAVKHFEHS